MSSINSHSAEFKTTMFSEPKSRRSVIKSISKGMTVAALSGCVPIRKPKQTIVTYTDEPTSIVGEPTYYATSCEHSNGVNGVLVTTHEGRPIKLDGNPLFPENNGRSDAYIQAEVQQLYDPDRLKNNQIDGREVNRSAIRSRIAKTNDMQSLIVMPNTHSIIHRNLLTQLTKRGHDVVFVDPVNQDNQRQLIHDVTGQFGWFDFDFRATHFVVNFGHDFLGMGDLSIKSKAQYIEHQEKITMVSFSDSLTITDSKADSVLSTTIHDQAHAMIYIAKTIINRLGTSQDKRLISSLKYDASRIDVDRLDALATKLMSLLGHAIIMVGESHSSTIHRLGFLLNNVLKNVNNTLHVMGSWTDSLSSIHGFEDAVSTIKKRLADSRVRRIVSIDVDLTRIIPDVASYLSGKEVIYVTPYENAWSKMANVVVSKTHFLEDWGVLQSKEGHICIQQPAIRPIYPESMATTDILLGLLNQSVTSYRHIVNVLKSRGVSLYQLKRDGFIKSTSPPNRLPIRRLPKVVSSNEWRSGMQLSVVPSYQMIDGRFSNNAWLNETPDPISKLTWGNALYVSHRFAKKNELVSGQVLDVTVDDRTISGPVLILPGQHDDTITVSYGHGKINNGVFSGHGINMDAFVPNRVYNVDSFRVTKDTVQLANVQMNHGLDEEALAAKGINDRIHSILQIKTMEEINHGHDHAGHKAKSLFKEQQYKGANQWGMSIDLNACLGCNTCMVACQAENNIPVVGRDQVIKGREMSWIRIDRYFVQNDYDETTINFMPVACVHCENAPCEQVCPVNATVHDDEGLNVMTYNRCIGTRYCANNCPYKVRRFNFFDWHQTNPQSVKKDRIHLFDYFREPAKTAQMQFNPDVTVRMRGVMEKCTYCLQRISKAKIHAKNTNDTGPIDTLKTACQQACPTDAIVFGDIANKNSRVSQKRASKRRYDLLQYELNTKPRTVYLSKIKRSVWGANKEMSHGHR